MPDYSEINTKIAKLMQNLKVDLGCKAIRQNYRGTGSRAARRQLFVTLPNGRMIDVWLELGSVEIGGVIQAPVGAIKTIHYEANTASEIYLGIRAALALVVKLQAHNALADKFVEQHLIHVVVGDEEN